ncbi:MAG TPA: nuclear transport factor 2 family protein [Acidobacteriaceae bacterium]|nr:nuclear transport factor 2 family protein [Acidobacteriaceae bacterium]
MRVIARCAVLSVLLLVGSGLPVRAQSSESAIRRVLADQQSAWNRGDIVAFMQGYSDSPQTTFIGKTIQHGYQMILARYRRKYGSRAAMGELMFSDLDVRMLGDEHAVVTGHFHLTRAAAGGGDAAGMFSLIFEKEKDGWKIILDHTSV